MPRLLKEKISSKAAKIAVMGLGYVGLPLAVNFAKAGFKVFGLDPDADRVEKICQKQSYIRDISSQELDEVVTAGRLKA